MDGVGLSGGKWGNVLICMYIRIYVLIGCKEAPTDTMAHNIETIKLVSHPFKLTDQKKIYICKRIIG